MNRAFIFDLDGVLIDNEAIWEDKKQKMYKTLFGESIHAKMGFTLGVSIDGIYERAKSHGLTIGKEEFLKAFYKLADDIYSSAPITHGADELFKYLVSAKFRVGVVSGSPLTWVTTQFKG